MAGQIAKGKKRWNTVVVRGIYGETRDRRRLPVGMRLLGFRPYAQLALFLTLRLGHVAGLAQVPGGGTGVEAGPARGGGKDHDPRQQERDAGQKNAPGAEEHSRHTCAEDFQGCPEYSQHL